MSRDDRRVIIKAALAALRDQLAAMAMVAAEGPPGACDDAWRTMVLDIVEQRRALMNERDRLNAEERAEEAGVPI